MPTNYDIEYPKLQRKLDELRAQVAELDNNRIAAELDSQSDWNEILILKKQLAEIAELPDYDGHFMDNDNRRIPSRVMRSEQVFAILNREKGDE